MLSMLRLVNRVGRAGGIAIAILGTTAAVAQAHDATFTYSPGTGDNGSCGSVNYSYYNFNAGQNTVQEYLTVGSNPELTKNFTFTASGVVTGPPYTFNASDTWAVPSGSTGEQVTAYASWYPAEAQGASSSSSGVIDTATTFTLQCAPVTDGPPTVKITTPANGATYYQGETVLANYGCTAGQNTTLQSCTGPVTDGSPVSTSTVGTNQCFTVTAVDADGQTASATNCYNVVALTYTGRAYNASVGATVAALGVPLSVTISPIEDTGAITTTSTAFGKTVTLASLNVPSILSLSALTDTVSTAPGTATGSSTAELNSLLGATEGTEVIGTTSSTTCNAGSLAYSGSTTLAALTIGGTKVVGPSGSGALVTTPIPPNTTVNLAGIGKLVLNEQLPLMVGGQQVGLTVNAIDLTLNTAPVTGALGTTVSGQVIVAHSESDIEGGCSAVTG
jgi:hypothetical protein